MVSRSEWYRRVNASWPTPVPQLTAEEAVKAARKLWRWGMGENWVGPIEVTSGNRYTWVRRGVLYVNPRSWDRFVHDVSHLLWYSANRGQAKPHDKGHARFELKIRKEVLRRGWLAGALKAKARAPQPKGGDARLVRYRSVVVRMERWQAKLARAKRALAKLQRAQRYYERAGVAAAGIAAAAGI